MCRGTEMDMKLEDTIRELNSVFGNLQKSVRGSGGKLENVYMLIDQSIAEVNEILERVKAISLELTDADFEYCLHKIRWTVEEGNPFQNFIEKKRRDQITMRSAAERLLETLTTLRLVFDRDR